LEIVTIKLEYITNKLNDNNPINNTPVVDSNSISAPNFILKNELGANIVLEKYNHSSKKLFLFTDKNCDACKESYPEIEKFTSSYPSVKTVVFILNTTPEELRKFKIENKYHFDTLAATEQTFGEYMIQTTPSAYLLDENNNIESIVEQFETKKDLEEFIFQIK